MSDDGRVASTGLAQPVLQGRVVLEIKLQGLVSISNMYMDVVYWVQSTAKRAAETNKIQSSSPSPPNPPVPPSAAGQAFVWGERYAKAQG